MSVFRHHSMPRREWCEQARRGVCGPNMAVTMWREIRPVCLLIVGIGQTIDVGRWGQRQLMAAGWPAREIRRSDAQTASRGGRAMTGKRRLDRVSHLLPPRSKGSELVTNAVGSKELWEEKAGERQRRTGTTTHSICDRPWEAVHDRF